MESIFEKNYELTYSHIDWRGVARPAAYFDFMQDAATLHARMAHLDRNELPIVWVLSRMTLELDCVLHAYDTLTLTTWCAGIQGASWLRAFSFSSQGKIVGKAISSWVILHPETHRILRPSTLSSASIYPCLDRDTLPVPGKLDTSGLPFHHNHTVMYSDLDINCHLNNVRVAALVCDCLDLQPDDHIQTLQINYTSETPAGTTLALSSARNGNTFRVRGEAQGKIRFEAVGTL